ncbi:MAG: hypothetical protein IJB90_03075 [Clostridia bacterium]|nr:hypothetical protein [Clostridia bacterium]
MSTDSKLKKEGIEIIEKLDASKVNKIAVNVASKLCLAFPEHNLKRSELFESLSSLCMYIAKMPEDSSGAKYFYKNNSIYFNEIFDIEEMSKLAVHECIHFIQNSNNSDKMGIYNSSSNSGLGLNEAAVQLMASEANFAENTSETYYGISFNTISPDYYPLQCALVNQISYFTGTYPLYHSTLTGNDVFKNTFTLKSDKKTYNTIIKNLDKLLILENDLNCFALELEYADKINSIKLLNKLINKNKSEIKSLFFKTQNLIMEKCFKNEFNSIRNMDDLRLFNKKLYNFKNIMGYSDDYTFYNEFYRKMMNAIQEKKVYIEKYGELNLFENINNSLMIVDNTKNVFAFISAFIAKCKKLVGLNKSEEKINDWL